MESGVRLFLLSASWLGVQFFENDAAGFGRSRAPATNNQVRETQAFPTRLLELGSVSAGSFQIPNNMRVDLSIDLPTLVDSEVNQSAKFRTFRPTIESGGQAMAIPAHGVLKASITSIELDFASIGVKVGYRPGGLASSNTSTDTASNTSTSTGTGTSTDIGNVSSASGVQLNGEVTVKLSAISMDFRVVDSVTNATYGAASADHVTTALNLSFKVDFTPGLSIGPEAQFRSRLSVAIRALMAQGMAKLAATPHINYLPWAASVREVDQARGLILFDAGVQTGLVVGNILSVYKACAVQNAECFERYTGVDVRTARVLQGYAEGAPRGIDAARMREVLNSVSPGDKVYITYLQGN